MQMSVLIVQSVNFSLLNILKYAVACLYCCMMVFLLLCLFQPFKAFLVTKILKRIIMPPVGLLGRLLSDARRYAV